MTKYEQIMAFAERYRNNKPIEKEIAYVVIKHTLGTIVLPVSYEKAIQELCRRMQY